MKTKKAKINNKVYLIYTKFAVHDSRVHIRIWEVKNPKQVLQYVWVATDEYGGFISVTKDLDRALKSVEIYSKNYPLEYFDNFSNFTVKQLEVL